MRWTCPGGDGKRAGMSGNRRKDAGTGGTDRLGDALRANLHRRKARARALRARDDGASEGAGPQPERPDTAHGARDGTGTGEDG